VFLPKPVFILVQVRSLSPFFLFFTPTPLTRIAPRTHPPSPRCRLPGWPARAVAPSCWSIGTTLVRLHFFGLCEQARTVVSTKYFVLFLSLFFLTLCARHESHDDCCVVSHRIDFSRILHSWTQSRCWPSSGQISALVGAHTRFLALSSFLSLFDHFLSFVSLTRRIEVFFASRASAHFCVTHAMKEYLQSEWNVR